MPAACRRTATRALTRFDRRRAAARCRSATRPRWRCSARRSTPSPTPPTSSPPYDDARHINLPNLAVFLWRLAAYRLRAVAAAGQGRHRSRRRSRPGLARFAVRFDLHPLDIAGAPVQHQPARLPAAPALRRRGLAADRSRRGAGPDARRAPHQRHARPAIPRPTCAIDFFDDAPTPPTGFDLGDVGLHLFLPQSRAAGASPTTDRGRFRGDNLCAWETGLRRPLRDGEIVIDPDIGRVLIGVGNRGAARRADRCRRARLRVAHLRELHLRRRRAGRRASGHAQRSRRPRRRRPAPRRARCPAASRCRTQLDDLDIATQPVVIEIHDSLVHRVDLAAVPGTVDRRRHSLRLAQSLTIRAADGHRPIVLLAQPLAFRPVNAADADDHDARRCGSKACTSRPIPATFPAGAALIERAAVARLEVIGCTLAPGGHALRDGSRAPLQPGDAPRQRLRLRRAGRRGGLRADARHRASSARSPARWRSTTATASTSRTASSMPASASAIRPAAPFAIAAATDPADAWGAPLDFHGLTCFGGGAGRRGRRLGRHLHAALRGARQPARLHQDGAGSAATPNRLPPNHFCVHAPDARQRLHLRVVQRSGLRAARARRRSPHPHARARTTTRWAPSASCSTRTSGPTCNVRLARVHAGGRAAADRTGHVTQGDSHARRLLRSELRPA